MTEPPENLPPENLPPENLPPENLPPENTPGESLPETPRQPKRKRALLDRVSITLMPAFFTTALPKGPLTLVICLQQYKQPGDLTRVVSCSFATNFRSHGLSAPILKARRVPALNLQAGRLPVPSYKAGDQVEIPFAQVQQEIESEQRREAAQVLPNSPLVGVIQPVKRSYLSPISHPDLGHLIGFALHAAGLSPAQFKEQPLVLSLYAALPPQERLRRLFSSVLPKDLYPKGLCLNVPDFQGRRFAVNVLTYDMAVLLGETGLNTHDMFWRPTVEGKGITFAPLICSSPYTAYTSMVGRDVTHYPSPEMAAEQARLILSATLCPDPGRQALANRHERAERQERLDAEDRFPDQEHLVYEDDILDMEGLDVEPPY